MQFSKGLSLSTALVLLQFWGLFSSGIVHAAAEKAPKIGFILSTMQEERYQRDKRIFEEAVTKLGGKVVFASCNNNEQTQAAEVDNLLSQGIKVLVIQPVNGETASTFAKQAKKDGVHVISYDRLINNAPLDAFITEDSYKVGVMQAEAAVKFTKGKGNYIILQGQAGHSASEARTKGILEVLSKYPDIKIVVKQYHPGWSPNLAMQTVENALTQYKNNIQAIIANNSGMAHGAVQALDEQKLTGKVFVAGADADLTAVRDILSGKQQLDVYVSIQDQASKAGEIAMALAQKKEFKWDGETENGTGKIKTFHSPVFAVEKNSIEERIIKTGFHPREAVYGKSASATKQ